MRLSKIGKRGDGSSWMTEETARVMVAVLVIVLLFVLVFKLGGIFFQNQAYAQAKATISEVKEIIQSSSGERFFLYESPKGWLFAVTTSNTGANSLCLCQPPSRGPFTNNIDRVNTACAKLGACVQFDKKVVVENVCYGNVPTCMLIEAVPTVISIDTSDQSKIVIRGEGTTLESRVLGDITHDATRFAILDSWIKERNNEAETKTLINEAIKRVSGKDATNWYFVIGEDYKTGKTFNILSKDPTKITEDVCVKALAGSGSTLIDLAFFSTRVASAVYNKYKDGEETPAEYCLGGGWFRGLIYQSEEKDAKRVLIEFRIDE